MLVYNTVLHVLLYVNSKNSQYSLSLAVLVSVEMTLFLIAVTRANSPAPLSVTRPLETEREMQWWVQRVAATCFHPRLNQKKNGK